MHIYLAGGTGALGRRLIPQLLERGHDVTATTRSADNAAALRALGAEPAIVDGLDGAAVGEAVARARPDAIVHQMTALSGDPDLKHFDRMFAATNALRTTGTEHLLAAAEATGVERLVVQSYTGWPNPRSGGPVKSEEDGLDPDPPAWQRESLAAFRYLEEAVPPRGALLRYGAFYGPGASDAIVEVLRKRRFPLVGDAAGVWSWVHIDDAASATVAAVEQGARGTFNVVDDDPAPVAEWLPFLAAAVGAKPPRRVPVWLGRLAAGDVGVSMITQSRGSSNAKIRRELGWAPRWSSWRQGFRDGLAA
jgi:nucleoside-diphosphate-sugar epimerase